MYADVIIDISHEKVDRPFRYLVPEELEKELEIGMRVMVPFGKGNTRREGYVIDLCEECSLDPARVKVIEQIVSPHGDATDSEPEANLIRLAAWMKTNYGSTMIQALKTVLPVRKEIKSIEKKTVVRIAGEDALYAGIEEAKRRKWTARERLLRELVQYERIPYEWVTGKMGVSLSTIRSLERDVYLKLERESTYRNPVNLGKNAYKGPKLSADQSYIVDEVIGDIDRQNVGTYLIHGITGSGKTQVYIELARAVVERGMQVIVLIPEIALTYQTLLRFYACFGDRVSVMNSTLSAGEKYDQCRRARNGEIDVIIGPRSALFTPFPHIGLIIIDEEHESSYKSENSPKYHARETAAELSRICRAALVLGSATPSLESYYRAQKGEYRLFTLKERLTGGTLPKVYTVDLREELRKGNRSVISDMLRDLLSDRLKRGQQAMLFLNRRGYAGFVSCRACGYVMKCPHCDVSLSEHGSAHMGYPSRLVCHYCGYTSPVPERCPNCGSGYIMGFKAGTMQVEEKIKEMYPGIRVLRMDADTTRNKDSYEKILTSFADGEADVLIGTQMIVKGHDFPNVTLVGIIAADLSLSVSDYRAAERTFQLLTQAAGRAGRGKLPGEVVIQTYQPDHYAIKYAVNQDYEGFYREEIAYRDLLGYPPVSHMLAVQITGESKEGCESLAEKLAETAKGFIGCEKDLCEQMMILGPSSALIGRINDIFRFVFYVKYGNYDTLVQVKDALEYEVRQISPRENVSFDFDPINTF